MPKEGRSPLWTFWDPSQLIIGSQILLSNNTLFTVSLKKLRGALFCRVRRASQQNLLGAPKSHQYDERACISEW